MTREIIVPERDVKSKLDDTNITGSILFALDKGASYRLAANYAGITFKTFNEWMKRAKEILKLTDEEFEEHPQRKYVDFYFKVKQIESQAALKWLKKIDEASHVQWQAAAWKLERRFPNEYGRNERPREASADNELSKARDEVNKLKAEENGRTP